MKQISLPDLKGTMERAGNSTECSTTELLTLLKVIEMQDAALARVEMGHWREDETFEANFSNLNRLKTSQRAAEKARAEVRKLVEFGGDK